MISSLKLHYLPFINPLVYDEISRLGDYCGLNLETNRDNPIIVSLTSEQKNFMRLRITLFSLLNQSLKPDKIILWLDEETEDLTTLPYEITQFIKNGLEIRFVKYKNAYTKTLCAFKEFKDAVTVTADDDIYYGKNWLKRLYYSYISSPEDIHVHSAHRVLLNENGHILPCKNWNRFINKESASYHNFPISKSGVLYPPNCFTNEAFRDDIISKYDYLHHNTWFWLMALTHNKKIRVVKNHYKLQYCTSMLNYIIKYNLSFEQSSENFDEVLNSLLKYYGQNIYKKL